MTRSASLAGSLMLAPLIGVTDDLYMALSFWGLSVAIVTLHGLCMGLIRTPLRDRLRLIASLVLAATWVSSAQLLLQAFALSLSEAMGVYLALISVQCVLLEESGFYRAGLGMMRVRLFGAFGVLLVILALIRPVVAGGTLAPAGFILLGATLAAWQAWANRSTPH